MSRSIPCATSPTAPPASRATRWPAPRPLGAEVTLVSGPVTLPDPEGVRVVKVETAHEMLAATLERFPPTSPSAPPPSPIGAPPTKRPRSSRSRARDRRDDPEAHAEPGHPRHRRRARAKRPRLVIGFAAETENLIDNATAKRRAKGADWIVANDVWPGTGAMGGDQTQVHLDHAGRRRGLAADEQGRDGGAAARPRRRSTRRQSARPRNERGGRGVSVTLRVLRLPSWRRAAAPPTTRSMPPVSMWWLACPRRHRSLSPGARALIPTGFAIELPAGFEAQFRPRSGLALKSA